MAVPVSPALLISVHVVHAIEVHDAVVQVVLVLLHLDVLVCAVAAVGRTLLAGHDSCSGGSLGGVTSWGEGVGSHLGGGHTGQGGDGDALFVLAQVC